MTLTAIGARHTYFLPNTGGRFNPTAPHLQIIVTDPCNSGMILSFSVGTYVPGKDSACLLNIGDHAKINRESTIYYGIEHIKSAAETLRKINAGQLDHVGLVTEPVFLRVCAGVRTSKFIKPMARQYIELQWAKMKIMLVK